MIYVFGSKPTMNKDTKRGAEFQKVMGIVWVKQKLVLGTANVHRIVTGIFCSDILGWWMLTLFSFGQSFDGL